MPTIYSLRPSEGEIQKVGTEIPWVGGGVTATSGRQRVFNVTVKDNEMNASFCVVDHTQRRDTNLPVLCAEILISESARVGDLRRRPKV